MAEIQERLESLEKEAKSIQSQVAEVCLIISFSWSEIGLHFLGQRNDQAFSKLGHFSVLSVVTSLKF